MLLTKYFFMLQCRQERVVKGAIGSGGMGAFSIAVERCSASRGEAGVGYLDKSMYSLILSDELVRAVDKLAYENKTSRSALINRILAERLSMVTPQMMIADVFSRVMEVAEGSSDLQVQGTPSATMLVMRSVIRTKYNPTVRYSVEISAEGKHTAGIFKVVSRSQSQTLLSKLTVFFELWSQIESTWLSERHPRLQLQYSISDGRFQRYLAVEQDGELLSSPQLGEAIGKFIRTFDESLNCYFSARQGVDMETFDRIVLLYRQYLDDTPVTI